MSSMTGRVTLLIAVAVFFAVVAGLVWFAFLRDVPIETAPAVIQAKTYKPAGTYWQQQVGADRGFRAATPISVAESYVLELRSEQLGTSGFFAVAPSEADRYVVGQNVTMSFRRRGLPLIGYKISVFSITPP